MAKFCALLLLTVLMSGLSLRAEEEEAPGIAVGKEAPAIDGTAWFTPDGKTPNLEGVHLVEFWFQA